MYYARRRFITTIIILLVLVCILSCMLLNKCSSSDGGDIGVNVTTGNVKVDIVNENEASLIGKTLSFVSGDSVTNAIFAPGSTYRTEGFKIKNIGSLSMEYFIYISESASLDKESFERAFEFWLSTDPDDLSTAQRLVSFTGNLDVGVCSETYYLVIKMRENAGNEFQNKSYSGIGITVHAVQMD